MPLDIIRQSRERGWATTRPRSRVHEQFIPFMERLSDFGSWRFSSALGGGVASPASTRQRSGLGFLGDPSSNTSQTQSSTLNPSLEMIT
jgi:hypothetical protein